VEALHAVVRANAGPVLLGEGEESGRGGEAVLQAFEGFWDLTPQSCSECGLSLFGLLQGISAKDLSQFGGPAA
jgi:hypothetical protein